MAWKLQALLWKFLPVDRDVSFTVRIFGLLLVLSVLAFAAGWFFRRRWMVRGAAGFAVLVVVAWTLLVALKPAWLRIAAQPVVPIPATSAYNWRTQAPGLETADLELKVGDELVDRMVLVRLNPQRYRLSVHWDPKASRTAEDWQRELGASVVVMGSFFSEKYVPLTPVRFAGQSAGPADYQSSHGAFVADGARVEILDLRDRNVSQAIGEYPEAMVSYPLLIDPKGENRAAESKGWFASRSFVAIDESGRVVLGTTRTGFFTLRRLGEFLKASPLGLRAALSLDGGPGVGQVVHAGNFTRNFHGTAEMSNDSDVLRAFLHAHSGVNWTLPIVLVATPVTP